MTEIEEEDCDCKVGKAIEAYSLDSLNEDIVWLRENENYSLRDIRDEINRRILESAIQEYSREMDSTGALEGILNEDELIERIYSSLQSPDEAPERTARIKTKLLQGGVDISLIEKDFVTHPTVKKHLNSCLDVDTSTSASIEESDAINTIEWARTRCRTIIETTVDRLVAADIVNIQSPEIGVSVTIRCQTCQQSYSPRELIDEGGCSCPREGG